MSTRYAPGNKAWGECGRSGRRMLLKEMVFDGRYPNMRVDPAWYEGKHPQETLPKVDDPIALYRPAPEALEPPTTPVLSGELAAGPSVRLTWSASTSPASLVAQYLVYRATGDDGEFHLAATVPVQRDEFGGVMSVHAYTDNAVQTGAAYRYYVTARAVKGGDSAPSNLITIALE